MLPEKAGRAPGTAVIAARALGAGRRTALIAAALALAVAGCGDSDDDDNGASGGEPGVTELTVTLDADGPGGEAARTETTTCGAETGDTACAGLQSTDFAPLDAATPCAQLYGGPDEAVLEGTVDGEAVTATLTRADGCAIERFDRFLPLIRELFPGYEPGASLQP